MATTVGELFNLYVQAYPRYGSEKKGLPTTYFLTIAEEPIRLHNELTEVDFVPLFDTNSFKQGDPLAGLVDGGTVFVPTPLTDPDEIWAALPPATRAEILARKIRLLALDTAALAKKYAPRQDLEIRMQGVALVGVFLKVSPFAERAGLDRPALMDGRAREPDPLLREARHRRRRRQPGRNPGRLRRRDRRHRGDIGRGPALDRQERRCPRGIAMTESRNVGDVMTPNPISISDTASLAEAAGILDSRKITGLPVVDASGALVGVLSQTDLVRAQANSAAQLRTGAAWPSGRS